MGLKARLKSLRGDIVRAGLGKAGRLVPEQYLANFACVGGASEQTYVINRLIGPATPQRVLVVGVFGGRDFWGLRVRGHEVSGFDLENVPDCQPTTKGDAEDVWPFPDGAFDVVVMGEVLEHLILDRHALFEVKRVLKAEGILVGSVPFLHDQNDYHVRIHTPATIQRLLHVSGFVVEEYVERPGLLEWRGLNFLNHTLAFASYWLLRKPIYEELGRMYGRMEWNLGRRRWLPRRLLKTLGLVNWGGTFRARPSSESLDYKEANRQEFCGKASLSVPAGAMLSPPRP